tara:strand:+ start:593 stop:814 length:222 start_codon:yes stop_codon:yes gene_type:complete
MKEKNKLTEKHGNLMRGLAYAGLEQVFSSEWIKLNSIDQDKIALDALDNCPDLREFRDLIGTGNLQSYANCIN